jgi:CHAD domain-containing protein/CYTH domain-containing protein
VNVERRHLRNLSEAPARRGIRLMALWQLQQAEATFTRLSTSADDEALHDFRVAVRRLRSHITNYREWLSESVERKQQRRLRQIARASNPSRDLEVLSAETQSLECKSELERAGATLLQERFRSGMKDAIRAFQTEALHDFPPLARELRHGLSVYLQQVKLDGRAEERLGRVAARLSARLRQEIHRQLAAVHSIEHQIETHDARIAGKKVRYLLEPFAEQRAACQAAVAGLREFQNALGHLHDVHVLMTETEVALHSPDPAQQQALAAVLDRIRALRTTVFAEVQREYIDPRATLLLDLVRAAERDLARDRRGYEIERKFLLKRLPRLKDAQDQLIEQGYLPGSDIRERIRRVETKDGERYFRTLKAGRGLTRLEIEEETTEPVFKKLFELTKGKRVRKRRYVVEDNGLRWEIDRFLDRKLVLAEVELESEDQPVEFPRWLRALIEREVTHDAEFTNERLAQ